MLTAAPTMVGLGASVAAVSCELNTLISLGEWEIALFESAWGNRPQTAHFRFICDEHAKEVCKRPCFCLVGSDHLPTSLPFLHSSV